MLTSNDGRENVPWLKEPNDCLECGGTEGIRIVDERTGIASTKNCECVHRRWVTEQMRVLRVPIEYHGITVENFVPDPAIHPGQAEVIEYIRHHPRFSTILSGDHGTGKSLIGYISALNAAEQGDYVIAYTLAEALHYIAKAKATFQPELPLGFEYCLTDERPVFVFLDEFDQTQISDKVMETLVMIFNGIYRNRHRLFLTSNLTVKGLTNHFSSLGVHRGLALMRKVLELYGMHPLELP